MSANLTTVNFFFIDLFQAAVAQAEFSENLGRLDSKTTVFSCILAAYLLSNIPLWPIGILIANAITVEL